MGLVSQDEVLAKNFACVCMSCSEVHQLATKRKTKEQKKKKKTDTVGMYEVGFFLMQSTVCSTLGEVGKVGSRDDALTIRLR